MWPCLLLLLTFKIPFPITYFEHLYSTSPREALPHKHKRTVFKCLKTIHIRVLIFTLPLLRASTTSANMKREVLIAPDSFNLQQNHRLSKITQDHLPTPACSILTVPNDRYPN